MALLFSAVRATANDQEVEFFVGGIPREYDDLEGWTAFDRFMEDIDEETEVSVHAKHFCHRNFVFDTDRFKERRIQFFIYIQTINNSFHYSSP